MSSPWLGCSTTVFTAARLSYSRWQPGARRSQILTAGAEQGGGVCVCGVWVGGGTRERERQAGSGNGVGWGEGGGAGWPKDAAKGPARGGGFRSARALARRGELLARRRRTRAVLAAAVHPLAVLLEPDRRHVAGVAVIRDDGLRIVAVHLVQAARGGGGGACVAGRSSFGGAAGQQQEPVAEPQPSRQQAAAARRMWGLPAAAIRVLSPVISSLLTYSGRRGAICSPPPSQAEHCNSQRGNPADAPRCAQTAAARLALCILQRAVANARGGFPEPAQRGGPGAQVGGGPGVARRRRLKRSCAPRRNSDVHALLCDRNRPLPAPQTSPSGREEPAPRPPSGPEPHSCCGAGLRST
jgi:hypothetical protein